MRVVSGVLTFAIIVTTLLIARLQHIHSPELNACRALALTEKDRELARSAERQQQIQFAANILSWTWDVDKNVFTFSGPQLSDHRSETLPALASKEELSPRIHPDDLPRVDAFYASILSEGPPTKPFVQRLISTDGRVAYTQLSGIVVERDAKGQICMVRGLSQDISEAVEQRQLLERQTAELENLAQSLNDAIDMSGLGYFNFDLVSGRVVTSPQCLKIHGIEQVSNHAALALRTLRSCLHPEDRERFYAATLQTGTPRLQLEYRIIRANDGMERKVRLDTRRVFGADNRLELSSGLIQDITEYENRVNELEVSIQTAEEARDAESRFLSHMSHEIRNPLNGISGLIQLAIDEDDISIIKTQLRTAGFAADQLRSIVDDILDFKTLEAGKLRVETLPFDYHAFRDSVNSLYTTTARAKNIALSFSTDKTELPRFVSGDATRLGQIISNLLSNAIKFTPQNGRISVVESYDVANERLQIQIKDTGIGMSVETQSKLFTRFMQASDGTTKHFKGTGLGLAITKQLLDLKGGTIDVHSALGEGSTFTVTVPLPLDREKEHTRREDDSTSHTEHTSRPTVGKSPIDMSTLCILCVDDDPVNLSVIVPLLNNAGADVRAAKSGKQALDILARFPIDLVVTDIAMPEMDGEQLIETLREAHPDIPVIAVTGNVLEEDVTRYLARGFRAVLAKPVNLNQLTQLVIQHAVTRLVDPPR